MFTVLLACGSPRPEPLLDSAPGVEDPQREPLAVWSWSGPPTRPDCEPGPELCDGLDNDCDGEIDEEPPTWFEDLDGDGFGDQPSESCEAPPEHVAQGGDCDDADPTVNPGAPETCDGRDTDCDANTTDRATALFLHLDGREEDLTGALTGSPGTPAALRIEDPGTLRLCEGDFYVNLELAASVAVEAWQDGEVVLSGGGAGSVVDVQGEDLELSLRGLELREGFGDSACQEGAYTSCGGALSCVGSGTRVVVEDSLFQSNAAGYGGGIAAEGCAVELVDSTVYLNDANRGGGLFLHGATARLERSVVRANDGTFGAGLFLQQGSEVWMEDSLVDANGGNYGAAVTLDDSHFTCADSAGTEKGFTGNDTSGAGAIWWLDDVSTFSADACDFGVPAQGNDNEQVDLDTSGVQYLAGLEASFRCEQSRCGSPASSSLGSSDSSEALDEALVGNVVQASADSTLLTWSVDATLDPSCVLDFYVYNSSTPTSGTWTLLWSSTSSGSSSAAPGLALRSGQAYALVTAARCSSSGDSVSFAYGGSASGDDLGWALRKGTVEAGGVTAVLNQHEHLEVGGGSERWHQSFGVTRL